MNADDYLFLEVLYLFISVIKLTAHLSGVKRVWVVYILLAMRDTWCKPNSLEAGYVILKKMVFTMQI